MQTYVVSGAASGIGAATSALLREQGHRVVTVDLRDADVNADLSTPGGRAAAVAGVRGLVDVVHGVVPAAGIGGFTGTDPALVVSVNFFGAVALVTGLRDQLAAAGGAGVVLLASNSITGQPGWAGDVAAACLAGDEESARSVAAAHEAVMVYPARPRAAPTTPARTCWPGRPGPPRARPPRPARRPRRRPGRPRPGRRASRAGR